VRRAALRRAQKCAARARKPRLGSKENPLIAAKCGACGIWHARPSLPESGAALCRRCAPEQWREQEAAAA
jgi:uncharacterized paraquat-inducible protein A